jgi:hypothetical protein
MRDFIVRTKADNARAAATRSKTMLRLAPERIWRNIDKGHPNECWPWRGKTERNGYGRTTFGGKRHNVSRIVFDLTNPGVLSRRLFVLHSCDNPVCCNPGHLRAGTAKENAEDRDKRNRSYKWTGAEHPRCKLTANQVVEIKELRRNGVTGRSVAKMFGVSPATISSIVHGRYYTEIGSGFSSE